METTEYANRLNQISSIVIGAAIEVHKTLGPSLYEEIYEECLKKELDIQGVRYQSQVTFPVIYKGIDTGKTYRFDLLVEDEVVVELKAVDELSKINEVQLVSYLRLLNKRLGLLINFNVVRLVDGVRRRVNNFGTPPIVQAQASAISTDASASSIQ
jgi:GxxExxY protein